MNVYLGRVGAEAVTTAIGYRAGRERAIFNVANPLDHPVEPTGRDRRVGRVDGNVRTLGLRPRQIRSGDIPVWQGIVHAFLEGDARQSDQRRPP
jgi:hypothetical protein